MKTAQSFSQYILDLHDGLNHTKQAEDRNVYEKYLSHAAVILAKIETGSSDDVFAEISAHEKLWGNSWLQDPIYEVSAKSYSNFKNLIGYNI